jgi:hypothetical protein
VAFFIKTNKEVIKMDETQEASQESEESVITDEMLDRAADGVDEVEEVATEDETTEEEVESEEVAEGEETEETEEEEAEEAPEEPEDNAERSRLGRRVSELETALLQAKQESENKLNETLEKLNSFLGKKEEPEEDDFFELPETKEDLAKLVREQLAKVQNEEVTQKTQAVKDYESGYIDTVGTLLEGEPDSAEILKLIEDEFNIKHSKVDNLQSGMKDAAKNILAAKTKLLSSSAKKVPLKGEKPRAPLGGGGGDKTPVAAQKMPKLDPAAAQYVKDTGMTPEQVLKAFG